MNRTNTLKLIFFVILCEIIGSIGAIFTTPNIPTWYATLTKPFFSPPNFLFAPVWTTLFLLMGISLYIVWNKKENLKKKGKKLNLQRKIALWLFGIQFALNVLWSYLFFGLRNPLFGFIGIVALWLSIIVTIVYFYKVDKKSAYLLMPYILWVSFAMLLNYFVMILN